MRFVGVLVVVCLLPGPTLIAGQGDSAGVGTICGTIISKKDNKPIGGAIAIISGTKFGACADKTGNICLGPVPPGVYAVVGQITGYHASRIDSVCVNPGCTTFVELQLEEEFLNGLWCPHVSTTSDVLRITEAQSSRRLRSDQLQVLPVLDVYDIVRKRGGVTVR